MLASSVIIAGASSANADRRLLIVTRSLIISSAVEQFTIEVTSLLEDRAK